MPCSIALPSNQSIIPSLHTFIMSRPSTTVKLNAPVNVVSSSSSPSSSTPSASAWNKPLTSILAVPAPSSQATTATGLSDHNASLNDYAQQSAFLQTLAAADLN